MCHDLCVTREPKTTKTKRAREPKTAEMMFACWWLRWLQVALPQITEEIVEVILPDAQISLSECIVEHIVRVLFPRVQEHTVKTVNMVPQGPWNRLGMTRFRKSWRERRKRFRWSSKRRARSARPAGCGTVIRCYEPGRYSPASGLDVAHDV